MLEQRLAELQVELRKGYRHHARTEEMILADIAKTRYAIKMRDREDALRAIYRDGAERADMCGND